MRLKQSAPTTPSLFLLIVALSKAVIYISAWVSTSTNIVSRLKQKQLSTSFCPRSETLGFTHYYDHARVTQQKRYHSTLNVANMVNSIDLVSCYLEQHSLIFEKINLADPEWVADIFNDLAHLSLDLATFYAPSQLYLKFFILLGRVFSIASDYVPDHSINSDEVCFQGLMLLLSTKSFVVSVLPVIKSKPMKTSFRDLSMYRNVFLKAGFTWEQYKAMLVDSLEWVDIESEIMSYDETKFILVTYRGDLCMICEDSEECALIECEIFDEGIIPKTNHYHVYSNNNKVTSNDDVDDIRHKNKTKRFQMIGDISFVKKLLDKKNQFSGNGMSISNIQKTKRMVHVSAKLPSGATVLRINVSHLMEFATVDESLADCLRNMVFNSLEERYGTSLM